MLCYEDGGPKAYGLYKSLKYDEKTDKYQPEETFRYPLLGAFEVFVHKGPVRTRVYSKLLTRRWPKIDEVCESILEVRLTAANVYKILNLKFD